MIRTVSALRAADQRHRALLMLHQRDAAQDEGAHDDLADIGFGNDQPPEIGARHADHLGRPRCASADQDLAVVEQVELAGELARAMAVDDTFLAMIAMIDDLDLAGADEEEIDRAFAAMEDIIAVCQRLVQAETRDSARHVLAQHREGLLEPGIGIAAVDRLRTRCGIAHFLRPFA